MKKTLIVTALVMFFALAGVVLSLVLPLVSVRDTRTERVLLEVSEDGESLSEIGAVAQTEGNGITLNAAYIANTDNQTVAYVLVYDIEAGAEGIFSIAVGLDSYDSRVLCVKMLPGSVKATNGSFVLWSESDYLDVYNSLSRSALTSVETLSTADISTSRICEAVRRAFETIDVWKESEDMYE